MKYFIGILIGTVLGLLIGGFYVYCRMKAMVYKLAQESLLKTNLINWITKEGLCLEEDEFYAQFQERAHFINLVSD